MPSRTLMLPIASLSCPARFHGMKPFTATFVLDVQSSPDKKHAPARSLATSGATRVSLVNIWLLPSSISDIWFYVAITQRFLTLFYISYRFIKQDYQVYPQYIQCCSFVENTNLTNSYSSEWFTKIYVGCNCSSISLPPWKMKFTHGSKPLSWTTELNASITNTKQSVMNGAESEIERSVVIK